MNRVLHIVKGLGLGGTEKVMQLMVLGLDRRRFEPVVLSLSDGERAEILRKGGVEVIVAADLFEAIVRLQPGIVHVHRAGWSEPPLMRPICAARLQLQRQNGKGFALVETNVFGRFDPSPEAASVDATLFVSHFCAQRFAAMHGIAQVAPRWQVLYNPIDFATISRQVTPPQMRDYSRPVVGRVSRADPGKWSQLALEWLPQACKTKPDLQYKIIGGIDSARAFVREHGLEARVEFLPLFIKDADLAEFLEGLSIFAHANDTGESFGLVIAEAMAAGLPVITHPAEGPRDNAQLELVEHGKTGLVVQTADEYAQAVLWLLANPAEARRMGLAGQEKAGREFAQAVIAARLGRIYSELLNL